MARGAGRQDGEETTAVVEETPRGKGRATPTRREREAANLRPLVSNDRRAANRAARAKLNEARDRARVGMANGEERYLPARDRGPQRRFVRDYVDARFSIGEALIPFTFVAILASLVPVVGGYFILAVYVFVLAAVIDCVILGAILKRRIEAKFGEGRMERGTRWYASMRAIQLRVLRLPKPQVKRGRYPA